MDTDDRDRNIEFNGKVIDSSCAWMVEKVSSELAIDSS